eukprot:TRINITY_DN88570_c0_g1_i1.p5 TRINITY_DN88570_c0_g1~~TRINITY_DN88570_c0_g1_i1.p5  ORF type:complete len:132 (+),score=11.85 TRINITY_DN88570_c0_g1_i1:551-946(+)
MGQLDLNQIFKNTTQDRLVRYIIRENEKLMEYIYPICSAKAGRKIETKLQIIDLSGSSSSLLTPTFYSFIKELSKIFQNYYPETLSVYACIQYKTIQAFCSQLPMESQSWLENCKNLLRLEDTTQGAYAGR